MAILFLWYLSFLVYPAYICWSLDFVMFYLCSFTVIKASHALRFWAQWAKYFANHICCEVYQCQRFFYETGASRKEAYSYVKGMYHYCGKFFLEGRGKGTFFHSYSKNCLHLMYNKWSDVSGSEQCIFA